VSKRIPARPSLKVIDRAIRTVEDRKFAWTCIALRDAEGVLWIEDSEYCRQYRLWVCKRVAPHWWNAPGAEFKAKRIAALKSFRQACIDAAIPAPGAAQAPATIPSTSASTP
jgi:hypothetical protein